MISWRRKWQPTPVFLPAESQGWQSLVGCFYGVAQSRTRLKRLSSSSSSSSRRNGASQSSVVKNPPANAGNAGDWGSFPGSRRSPGEGNGNLLQYSCLGNPMSREAWWTADHRVSKSQTQLSDWACTQWERIFVLLFVCFGFFFFFLPEKLLEKRFQTLGEKMLFKYVSFLMKKVIECFDQIPQKTHFFFAS